MCSARWETVGRGGQGWAARTDTELTKGSVREARPHEGYRRPPMASDPCTRMDTKREHAVGEGPAPAREEPPSTPAPLLVRGRPAPPHLRCRRARLPTVRGPHVGDRDHRGPGEIGR